MVNALFFPAVSTLGLASNTELWRVATKTSNTYNNYLVMEMVFRYFDNPTELDLTGKYMTLFHQGTGSSSTGFSVCLYKDASGNISVGIRYKDSSGANWTDLSGSFVNLNTINLDGFYIMFQYNYSSTNKIVNFYVVEYNNDNATTKTKPDFIFPTTTTPGPAVGTTNLNQWGFGSLPQSLTLSSNPNGYNNLNEYNGYIAQNVQVLYLRTWNPENLIPDTSSTAQYAMFNSNPTYSLYNINKTQSYVPALTDKLNFQLEIPSDSTNLSDLKNNAVSPSVPVTTTTSTTNFKTLYDFAVNSTSGFNIVETSEIPCLLKGTQILTSTGYKSIEDIKIGEYIISHDNRHLKVIDIYHNFALKSDSVKAICIKKGEYKLPDGTIINILWDLNISYNYILFCMSILAIASAISLFITMSRIPNLK